MGQDRSTGRRTRLALLVIVLIGLGVRGAYLASDPYPNPQTLLEGEMAHNIVAHGRWLEIDEGVNPALTRRAEREHRLIDPSEYSRLHGRPLWQAEIFQPVGSAVLLAGLWQITGGERYLPLQILQGIVDSLIALLVYWIALQLFKRRSVALIAAALYALYLPVAQLTRQPYVDIWGADFTVAIVAIYLKATISSHRLRWWLVCGLVTGLGVYFRPNLVILPPILMLATLAAAGWRETLRRGLIVVAMVSLLLAPWIVRNFEEFDAFIPTTSGLGETLWEGLGELHNNFGATFDSKVTRAQVHRVAPDVRFESPAYDDLLLRWGVRAVEQHPGYYVKLLAYRTAESIWLFDQAWMHRGAATPFGSGSGPLAFAVAHPLEVAEDALNPVIFAGALFVLLRTWRQWKREHLILIAIALSVLVPYILLLVQPRYLYPAEFVYLIWVALGVDHLIRRFRPRRAVALPVSPGHDRKIVQRRADDPIATPPAAPRQRSDARS